MQQTARDAFLAAGFGDLAPKPRTDYEALKEALGELKGKDEMPDDTVLTGDNAVFWAVLQTGQVTPLAIGGPGTAKTKSIEAISTDVALRYQAVAGCVGDDWAHEFRQWEQALDLPDPEEVLAKAMAEIGAGRPVEDGFLPGRADQVLAFLGALADRVLRHGNTRQRWEAGMEVLGLVWKSWKEVAIIGGAALAQGYKAGYRVPADFSGQALPLMVRAGMVQGGVP